MYNYPNPFKNTTTIVFPKEHKKLNIRVIDMLGRVVQQEELEVSVNQPRTTTFTSKHLNPGVYQYIIVGDKSKEYVGNFIIY